jgi:hypothetical protein
MLDPIETEMEGGNLRSRSRPGDNVGTVGQTIRMTTAEYATFVTWVKTTLNNGTSRFTTNVWLGTAYVSKVCQFQKGGVPTMTPISSLKVAVTMTLRVYDV